MRFYSRTGQVVPDPGTTADSGEGATTSEGIVRLSDGTAFYDAARTGQLPAALVNGRLAVDIGAAPAGGGGPVTVADGADVAEGTTSDVAWVGTGSGSLVAISKAEYAKLEAIRSLLAGSLTVSGPLTDTQLRATALPVSLAAVPAHSVSVSNFPATQPVSLAANTPDVTDRAARLLGHVTVDNASLPVTGPLTDAQLRASAIPTTKVIGAGQANVLKTGSLVTTAVTADQVVLTYTVTAAKTLYLCYVVMYGRLTVVAATASILGAISLETPSGTKAITLDDINPTTSEVEFNPIVFAEPIPIAAGVVVRVVVTPAAATSMTWRANFGGYEK